MTDTRQLPPSDSDRPAPSAGETAAAPQPPGWRNQLLIRFPWFAFIAPLAAYLILGQFEATFAAPEGTSSANGWSAYLIAYSLKIALTAAIVWVAWPAYKQFRPRGMLLAVLVGVVGVVVWVGLCQLGLERRLIFPILSPLLERAGLSSLITSAARPGFNPFDHWADAPWVIVLFLPVRFFGLVAIVPLIEEFFYRGFLMRWVTKPEWTEVPEGLSSWPAVMLGTLVPMTLHPLHEWLAAAAFFSMITWLYLRTRSIWACVAAHSTTNLLLGAYIIATGHWELW
ncbi:MAG: CAAX prenyl protease-related protein [Planctomycetota bacterium]